MSRVPFKKAVAISKEIGFQFAKTDAAFEALIWSVAIKCPVGVYQMAIDLLFSGTRRFWRSSEEKMISLKLGRAYHAWGS